jgi:hypothetical protein
MARYRITHTTPSIEVDGESAVDFDGEFEGRGGSRDRIAALAVALPISWRQGITLDADNTTIAEV